MDRTAIDLPTRRRVDALAVGVGAVVVALGMVVVGDGRLPAAERSVFRVVNGLPDAIYPVLWPFQQLGALLVAPALAVVAAALRRRRLAVALLLATVAKLALERVVKWVVSRERPAVSVGEVEIRGDVELAGESFVSGHAVLVTAVAVLVAPYLRGRWKLVPWLAVALVLFTRVYVGAHNPLDVASGAGVGAVIGGGVNLALGAPRTGEVR